MARNDLIAGLDIGTTKICCVVAEMAEPGGLLVSGIGVSPSTGLKRGIVVDLDSTIHAIEDAVLRAARQSGREITSAFVGVTGEHIASLNARGVIAITHADREINQDDLERVLEASRVIVIPPDRIILHAIPRAYSIDGQNGIKHPIGMSGTRLEVETHIVTGGHTFLQNVEKCVTRAGLAVEDMVLEPLATAEAVLMPAERELGVCMADIGGGTTDVAVYQNGEIFYSAVIPVGGSHVTGDLAQLLRISPDEAEKLKIAHGSASVSGVAEEERVPVRQIGRDEPRMLRRRALCEIIEARMQELLQLVQKEIMKSGCHNLLPAGVVLTGGGSQLRGTPETAGHVLGMPVRLGRPAAIAGLGDAVDNPSFSTAVGLVRYGVNRRQSRDHHSSGRMPLGGMVRWASRVLSRFRTD